MLARCRRTDNFAAGYIFNVIIAESFTNPNSLDIWFAPDHGGSGCSFWSTGKILKPPDVRKSVEAREINDELEVDKRS
jgi:hypothetical protein